MENAMSGSQTAGRFNQLFFGCLIVGLAGMLFFVMVVMGWLIVGKRAVFFPAPTFTITPSLTFAPAFTETPTQTASPTPTLTFTLTSTLTPSSTPSNTPSPTFTATFTPTRTPTRTVTPTPRALGDASYALTYDNWWGRRTQNAYGQGMRCSETGGQRITFESGEATRSLTLMLYRGPDQGRVRVYIDGTAVGVVDLYRDTPKYNFEKTYDGLSNETHTVTLEVIHRKSPASRGYWVCLDGIRTDTHVLDDAHPQFQYGSWLGRKNQNAQGGGFRISRRKNATLSFSFTGTSFTWVTALGPDYGKANVYVDGLLWDTVDLYRPRRIWQYYIYVDGLSDGEHTVKIVVLNQRNPASTAMGVVVDGVILP